MINDIADPETYKRTKKESFKFNDDVEDIYKAWQGLVDPESIAWSNITKVIHDFIEHNVHDEKSLMKRVSESRKKLKHTYRKSEMLHVLLSLRERGELNNVSEEQFQVLRQVLVKKGGKSTSGILSVTVVTSPYPEVEGTKQEFSCDWNCYYCPNEPGQPRSYLHDEPSVLRANRNRFDAVLQFCDRVVTLATNGHPVDKIELLVLGGTWASYPVEYQESFIRDLFYAANTFFVPKNKRAKLTLSEEKSLNEKAQCKIIGITLETRPDCIDAEELKRLRYYGCTRVQLGVQHTDDTILKKINRGCTTEDTKRALRLLKNSCFKVDIHLMPNLPGANPDIDREMFRNVLSDEGLQADQWKIYPCEVTPWTVIQQWYESGKYKPYSEEELVEVLIDVKSKVHPWIRLNRVVRDIPSQYIIGGVDNPSMRQVIQHKMEQRNLKCKCIRCREIKDKTRTDEELVVREYKASNGTEYFISMETTDRSTILGFARLRINPEALQRPKTVQVASTENAPERGRKKANNTSSRAAMRSKSPAAIRASMKRKEAADLLAFEQETPFPELRGAALVRELHVYGQLIPTYMKTRNTQHTGIGTRLMKEAEDIARRHKCTKIAVIAGVGVRDFYRKIGYSLQGQGEMMIRELSPIRHEHVCFDKRVWLIAFVVLILSTLWSFTSDWNFDSRE